MKSKFNKPDTVCPNGVKNDYLHLYLGCECEVIGTGFIGKIDTVFDDGTIATGLGRFPFVQTLRGDEIKPLLRPLTDMTHEELQECGNMIYDFSDEPDLNNHKWEDFQTLLDPMQFVWLLKKGFDLFGLIESGLAIDKTKQNETK
jgi:hypothetical protein